MKTWLFFNSGSTNSYQNAEYNGTRSDDVIDVSNITERGNGLGIAVNAFLGNDSVTGSNFQDSIYLGRGNDSAHGGSGNDQIYGDFGNDTLDGGEGLDWVIGGAGDDTLTYVLSDNLGNLDNYLGGVGQDTLVIELTSSQYNIHKAELAEYKAYLADFADNSLVAGGDYTFKKFGLTVSGFETLIVKKDGVTATLPDITRGSDVSNNITSTSSDSIVFAYSGDDTINGQGGNDSLDGGAGDDTIYGGAGDDVITGGAGYDTVYGEGGDDIVYFNSTEDAVYTNDYYGGLGTDTVVFEISSSEYAVFKDEIDLYNYYLQNNSDANATGDVQTNSIGMILSDFEEVEAYADGIQQTHNNVILGTSSLETLTATSGNDSVYGYEGDDTLYGQDGDDRLFGGDGDDTLWGQGGVEVLIPYLAGFGIGLQAAVFRFIAGVMPPIAMLGRSLLYVHSQRVACSCASSMVSNMYCPSHSWRAVRL